MCRGQAGGGESGTPPLLRRWRAGTGTWGWQGQGLPSPPLLQVRGLCTVMLHTLPCSPPREGAPCATTGSGRCWGCCRHGAGGGAGGPIPNSWSERCLPARCVAGIRVQGCRSFLLPGATRNWGAEGEPCFCSPPLPCAVLSPPGASRARKLSPCARCWLLCCQLRALQVGEGQKDLGLWCRGC